jgi:hypothetical protein
MSLVQGPEEGQPVALVTAGWNDTPATGRLLAITGSSGHVKWDTGHEAGKITLTDLNDLVTTGPAPVARTAVLDDWADSLDVDEGFTVEGSIPEDVWLFGGDGLGEEGL